MAYPNCADVLAVLDGAPPENTVLHPSLPGLISTLALHHTAQWRLEDQCRLTAAPDRVIASAKRQIDGLNAKRTQTIERIDAVATYPQDRSAIPHTETLGQILDRLVIAWVRVQMLAEAGAPVRPKLARARAQLRELGMAYDGVVADVASGIRRFPQWLTLKQYGRPVTSPRASPGRRRPRRHAGSSRGAAPGR